MDTSVKIHEEIQSYIDLMKFFMIWYGEISPYSDSFIDRCRKFHANTKWISMIIMFGIVNYLLYHLDHFGAFDGFFLHWLNGLNMTVIHTIERFSGHYQNRMALSLSNAFQTNDEPWMKDIRDKYIIPVRKFMKLYHLMNIVTGSAYIFLPLVADTILHYGFDCLEQPFWLLMPLSSLLINRKKWDVTYYLITLVNMWFTVEVVLTIRWYIANFSLLTTFFLTELVILKERVKKLQFEDESTLKQQVKFIVDRHNEVIELNGELNNYLGLSGAFMCFFTAAALTLTGFTMYFNPGNIPLCVSYGSGFMLWGSSALLYCLIGQELENECNDLLAELYNLPWFRFSTSARKSLHMMMAQVRTNMLTINYHGYYTLNLAGYGDILVSTYSYFTLLQSLAEA